MKIATFFSLRKFLVTKRHYFLRIRMLNTSLTVITCDKTKYILSKYIIRSTVCLKRDFCVYFDPLKRNTYCSKTCIFIISRRVSSSGSTIAKLCWSFKIVQGLIFYRICRENGKELTNRNPPCAGFIHVGDRHL